MFYSQFILAKKGPLGTIWIAAHLERKLRKNQVADTDIGFSVDSILFPEMPIALRLSSHLLLGVVRIYSRKVNYLFDDCSEALLKVKQAFRSTAVDLPPEESTAPYHSITLPETFDLDDFELPGSEIFQGNYVDHHISSKEQITLQDTMEGVIYSTSKFGLDERFGDGDASGLDLEEELLVEKAEAAEHATGTSYSDVDPQASVQVNALFKYDHNQDTPTIPEAMPAGGIMYQHVDEYDGDDGPVEYAHAPCTPGLWEEPNLSNIQETSAYDDHQEPENHTISEFAVKENIENASSEQHHNEFEPLEKSLPHIATTEQMSLEQSPRHMATTGQMSLDQPPPHIATTEQMSMNGLGSTPFTESHTVDQVSSMSPVVEMSEIVVSVVDDPVKVVSLLNKNATHQEPEAQTVDDNRENYVEHQGISNNISHVINQANAFHHTFELELNTEPPGEHNLVSTQDQAFRQPKDSTIPMQSTHDSMSNFDTMGLRPCVTLSNHDAAKHDTSLPSSEFTSLPSVETSRREEHPSAYEAPIIVQGEAPLATEPLEINFQETYRTETVPSNVVQVASSIPDRQVENASGSEVQVHNTNSYNADSYNTNSYTSNFPAPEKLLSFSQGHSDVPNNLVPESTPMIEPPGYGRDAGTNMYSGRKRSITESSMTNQSLNFNLNESSTFFNTNMTSESFRDDDLLSSILVGRNTSILKMKPTPTPSTEVPSTKRRRQSAPKTAVPASKTGILKRKVLMDDNMVLHGDTIRQQLTNTEDIRRLRKKAPCTHSEISMIKKQFWEDELFGEAILTGMSNKLTSLHRQLYDISKIAVSQYDASLKVGTDQKSISHNDEKDIQPEMGTEYTSVSVELDALKENKEQDSFIPVPMKDVSEEAQPVDVLEENKEHDDFNHVAMKEVSEAQPIEAPLVTDNHTHDKNTTDLDYYENQAHMHTTGDFTELFGPDHDILENGTAMEIDGKSFPDSDTGVPVMPVEAESLTHADVVPSDTFDTSAAVAHADVVQGETFDTSAALAHANDARGDAFDTSAVLAEVEKTRQMVASLLDGPPPGFGTYERVDLQSADNGPPMDININNSFESNVASEIKLDDALVGEIPEEKQEVVADASTTFSSETGGLKSDILTLDQEDTGIRNNEVEIVNKDIECNPENLVSNGVFGEEFVPVAAYDTEGNPVLEDYLLDEREKRGHHATIPMTTLNLEDIPADNRVDVDNADYMYSGVANDTDFLNFDDVDDDEAGDAADDDMPDGEETKILDNSGWSSRTRAVAKYLQIMFDKEGERGRNMLAVNNLLGGKTRKEASRMFFETLVLKTKDYIHVEQTDPFENINVFPRSKLLKSEF